MEGIRMDYYPLEGRWYPLPQGMAGGGLVDAGFSSWRYKGQVFTVTSKAERPRIEERRN